jgi:ketosteroid isomerase-like protein
VSIGIRKIVVLDDNVAYVTGFDEFTATRNGETRKSPAGFIMVLVKHGNDWLIAHQHSSRRSTPTQG